MAGRGMSFAQNPSGTIATALVLLVFLQATLVWKEGTSAPGKRDDVLAGTEFLSVFINGAMAQPPIRRRGSRRGGIISTDNVAAESQRQEASIYRISRTSRTSSAPPPRQDEEDDSRVSPISQKSVESSASFTSLLDNLSTASEIGSMLTPRSEPVSQKVIGVSVTSTVEATPYKVRVEHHVDDEMTTPTTTPIAFVTPLPALTAADELSNIVSESNRSEFSVDEGAPRSSWRLRPRTTTPRTRGLRPSHRHHRKETGESVEATGPDGKAPHPQGRKAGRHYQTLLFTQHPSRLYGEAENLRGSIRSRRRSTASQRRSTENRSAFTPSLRRSIPSPQRSTPSLQRSIPSQRGSIRNQRRSTDLTDAPLNPLTNRRSRITRLTRPSASGATAMSTDYRPSPNPRGPRTPTMGIRSATSSRGGTTAGIESRNAHPTDSSSANTASLVTTTDRLEAFDTPPIAVSILSSFTKLL
ncbi:uncharacterized protein LOC124407288 isoform X2 [Diprion similis]|uniref:uncharacterized protein LOC124407288 isoform X2 n=1 Tax=Diprion similis TaxID=362088 RepID=UPI001EF8B130|nr:uncharacterized protein LOC124407288 isoform X2 [Diprion similis]